jgi:hypothetical protein
MALAPAKPQAIFRRYTTDTPVLAIFLQRQANAADKTAKAEVIARQKERAQGGRRRRVKRRTSSLRGNSPNTAVCDAGDWGRSLSPAKTVTCWPHRSDGVV